MKVINLNQETYDSIKDKLSSEDHQKLNCYYYLLTRDCGLATTIEKDNLTVETPILSDFGLYSKYDLKLISLDNLWHLIQKIRNKIDHKNLPTYYYKGL